MNSSDVAGLLIAGFAFRCVPFVLYALVAPGIAWDSKATCLLLFTALVLLADTLGAPVTQVLFAAPLALAYFAAVSSGMHMLRPLVARGRMPHSVVFGVAAAGYLVLPALVVRTPAVVPALVVGWEAMLSAYSYCLDAKDGRTSPRLSDCLFFILVNPCLVYAERGRKVPDSGSPWRGVLRCLGGLLTWGAQSTSVWIIGSYMAEGVRPDGSDPYSYFLVRFWSNALVLYLGHSGLASIQIGLMRLAGWQVPERYRYPFLATSPADFWRRWNSYVTSWARRYLFTPWALKLGRAWPVRRSTALATAAIGTFVAIGGLHALQQYLVIHAGEPPEWSPLTVLGLFTTFGLAFVVWEGIARSMRTIDRPALRPAKPILSWLLFSNLTAVGVWVALRWASSATTPAEIKPAPEIHKGHAPVARNGAAE